MQPEKTKFKRSRRQPPTAQICKIGFLQDRAERGSFGREFGGDDARRDGIVDRRQNAVDLCVVLTTATAVIMLLGGIICTPLSGACSLAH